MEPTLRTTFERQYRTATSEGYHLLAGEKRLGHLDLHFTQTNVYASLVLEITMSEEQVLDLIERIDESLVLSAEVPREDLLVTVFHGTQTGLYSDDFLRERVERRVAARTTAGVPTGPTRPTRSKPVN